MQRVKNVDYDADDLYDEEEDEADEGGQGYTADDRNNFASLTPVVRAELEEAGLQASDKEIEEALWHYYWDVSKSVSYLKNSRTPRPQQQGTKKEDKPKAKTKFDQAAEKSAEKAGEFDISFGWCHAAMDHGIERGKGRRGGFCSSTLCGYMLTKYLTDRRIMPPVSAADWFQGTPWNAIPSAVEGCLVPAEPTRPMPKLLGGSSKLVKLAEERRRKAAAATANEPSSPAANPALSSLDRLSKFKDSKENETPVPKAEPKKYPMRKKREPTPPPKEPSPPPPEPEEEKPDLRASPTSFGQALSTSPSQGRFSSNMTLGDMLGPEVSEDDPFKGPSPDDTVLRAQGHSKGLAK